YMPSTSKQLSLILLLIILVGCTSILPQEVLRQTITSSLTLPTIAYTSVTEFPSTPVSTPINITNLTKTELINWIINHKQIGSSLSSVSSLLEQAQRIPPEESLIPESTSAAKADFDQDGNEEWIFSLLTDEEVDSCSAQLGGEVIILNEFGILFQFNEQDYSQIDGAGIAPAISLISDINNDGYLDIILQNQYCQFAGRASESFMVSSVTGSFEVKNWQVEGRTYKSFLGSAGTVQWDPADTRTLKIYPISQRHQEKGHAFIWKDNQLTLIETILQEPVERYFLLLDTNTELSKLDFQSAKANYQRIISDTSLIDIVIASEDDGKNAVQSFAAFRLMLIAAQENNSSALSQWSNWMEINAEEDWIVESTQLFVELFNEEQDFSIICKQVNQLSKENFPWKFDPWISAGFPHPDLYPIDLCPF
ncbi:MAG: hypothetical protein AAF902_12545, partial [Chloroflexota bacterium]